MSLGSSFLKPAIAPLNFANVSLMGRLIPSGLKELAADNLVRQLRAGVGDAAKEAGVRPVDIEKLIPMSRFLELAKKLDGHQKVAHGAWDNRPVDFERTGDLAHLTEEQNLPVLADSLMRLATMANANPNLRMALYEMSHIMREWQQLVLETGNKLEAPNILADAIRWRAIRRGAVVVLGLGVLGIGGVRWQQVEQARTRIGAFAADENACAVETIDPADMAHVTPELQKRIATRKGECEAKRAAEAKAKEERERQELYAKECEALADAVAHQKEPPPSKAVHGKLVAFAKRVATSALEPSDLGPDEPSFPCADTDGHASMLGAFDHAVVRSKLWLTHVDLSSRSKAALEKYKSDVPREALEELDTRAEKLAVEALQDTRPVLVREARHQCALKSTFGLSHRAFCAAILK